MLLDDGVDLHSYQPTAEDLEKIASCDLFIYVGGESDEWVEDALKSKTNKNRVEINLMDALGDSVKEEEEVEGMQSEDEHEHEGEEAESEEPEQDEHIWLSLRNAEVCTQAIADQLKKLDPSNKTEYEDNATAYKEELTGLDKEYQDTVEHAKRKTLLFADRFPFRYLADDYGLKYYAAFKGCSAETEASFKTITFLANAADPDHGLHAVYYSSGCEGWQILSFCYGRKSQRITESIELAGGVLWHSSSVEMSQLDTAQK